MKARAKLTFRFAAAGEAKAVAEAVSLDDEGYIRTRRSGASITAEASAESPMALLHTLDDYLACVSVAQRTAEAARLRARRPRRRA